MTPWQKTAHLFAVCVLSLSVFLLGACGSGKSASAKNSPPPSKPQRTLLTPTVGAYLGAFLAANEDSVTEDDITLEKIDAYEDQVGKHQAILSFSSFWGEQSFPLEQAMIIQRHNSVPFIFWSPWDRPYLETRGPDKFRLDAIIQGQWDAYIDSWADAARDYGGPIFVSFCNEMNGNWFPWSGTFYGAGEHVNDPSATPAPAVPGKPPGAPYEGPEFFKKAFRYVVDRVRARGATNILWVFHVNNFSEPLVAWNAISQYYPGPDYIDWMGVSAYGQQFPNGDWKDFDSMFRSAYEELRRLDETKPIMVAEWGVGEFPKRPDKPGGGDKAAWFDDALSSMRTDYPQLHAAIYWNERWENSGGASAGLFSNLRVNSSPQALEAFRRGIDYPYWLGEPILK